MKKICATITCALLFIFTVSAASAEDASFSVARLRPLAGFETAASVPILKNGEVHYHYTTLPIHAEGIFTIHPLLEENGEYEETPFRRFEIVLFISIPMTLALSFAGLAAYKVTAGTWEGWGNFENVDKLYLSLSTFSLSLSVAIHDYRVIYKKRGT
jgi:hypothetical protein